jgi:hypothetical protein
MSQARRGLALAGLVAATLLAFLVPVADAASASPGAVRNPVGAAANHDVTANFYATYYCGFDYASCRTTRRDYGRYYNVGPIGYNSPGHTCPSGNCDGYWFDYWSR